jgi:hypothetical protein
LHQVDPTPILNWNIKDAPPCQELHQITKRIFITIFDGPAAFFFAVGTILYMTYDTV